VYGNSWYCEDLAGKHHAKTLLPSDHLIKEGFFIEFEIPAPSSSYVDIAIGEAYDDARNT
jgi:hypothetical protein